jgi:hypothetical protein
MSDTNLLGGFNGIGAANYPSGGGVGGPGGLGNQNLYY